jgi:hypothetical protein
MCELPIVPYPWSMEKCTLGEQNNTELQFYYHKDMSPTFKLYSASLSPSLSFAYWVT